MAIAATYSGLKFSFARIKSEMENVCKTARQLLEVESVSQVLPEFVSKLGIASNTAGKKKHFIEISEQNPLRTRASDSFEPYPRTGGMKVYGELSFKWEIQTEGRLPDSHFELIGIASIKIRLFKKLRNRARLMAQWQFEVGDHQSPGCHFHVGVGQRYHNQLFPTGFSIPRLPSMLVTPVDALDFMLGELFQKEWREKSSLGSADVQMWASNQADRLHRLAKWHIDTVVNGEGSAWIRLKAEKPPLGIFG